MNSVFTPDVARCSASDLVSTPRALSSPERLVAETLVTAKQSIAAVLTDPILRPALRLRGYDDRAIEAGRSLEEAAEAEFVHCQNALGELDRATSEFEELWTATRDDYVEFRGTIRSLFAPKEGATLFNVHGQVAPQLTDFAAQATTSYSRALEFKVLERAGYDDAWLQTAISNLHSLVELDTIVGQRAAHAAEKSAARNRALEQYTCWASRLIQDARVATSLLHRPPS